MKQIMSLDGIIGFFRKECDLVDKESSEIYINKKFVKNNNSSVLKIILPPWGEEESFITGILIRRLYKNGYSCAGYSFPSYILSSDVNKTIKFFAFIRDQIKSDISKFKSDFNFKRIDIIASSLGVISACLIANDNSDIQNIFFIVPGSNLASSLWNGIRTQKLKNMYEQQNISQGQLVNIWAALAPKNNINAMSNKNIFVAISKSDKVIPYCFGKELADLMIKMYPRNTLVQENNHLGHYLTVVKYYLFDKELLK